MSQPRDLNSGLMTLLADLRFVVMPGMIGFGISLELVDRFYDVAGSRHDRHSCDGLTHLENDGSEFGVGIHPRQERCALGSAKKPIGLPARWGGTGCAALVQRIKSYEIRIWDFIARDVSLNGGALSRVSEIWREAGTSTI